MKLYIPFLFIVLMIFTACNNDKTVTKFYQKIEIKKIDSIDLISIYPDIKDKILQALENKNLKLKADSIYSIKVDYLNYEKVCNNPMTSAYDATFDGFIRLTLLKNDKRIYMCQKEFRGELVASDVEKLLSLMRSDLEF